MRVPHAAAAAGSLHRHVSYIDGRDGRGVRTTTKGSSKGARAPRRPRATTATGRSRRGRSRRSSRTWLSTSASPFQGPTAAARRCLEASYSRPSRRAPRAAPRASRPSPPSCACGAAARPCRPPAARARGSVWTATGEFSRRWRATDPLVTVHAIERPRRRLSIFRRGRRTPSPKSPLLIAARGTWALAARFSAISLSLHLRRARPRSGRAAPCTGRPSSCGRRRAACRRP